MSREAFRFLDPTVARTAAVDAPSVPGKRRRRGNEDWSLEPCRKCKTHAMLWWKFCPFCGTQFTQIPMVLDDKIMADEASDPKAVVRAGSFIGEGIDHGIVIASGAKTYDVVWIGGSTTRYRHGERDVRVVSSAELDKYTREHLVGESAAARRERRAGAGVRRGTVSPRR